MCVSVREKACCEECECESERADIMKSVSVCVGGGT